MITCWNCKSEYEESIGICPICFSMESDKDSLSEDGLLDSEKDLSYEELEVRRKEELKLRKKRKKLYKRRVRMLKLRSRLNTLALLLFLVVVGAVAYSYITGYSVDYMVANTRNNINEMISSKEDVPDEGKIYSGGYIIGEDLKGGNYTFEARSGIGVLLIYNSYDSFVSDSSKENANIKINMCPTELMAGKKGYMDVFSGIKLSKGQYIDIEGDIVLNYSVK